MSFLLGFAEFVAMLFGGIFVLVMLTYVIQGMMWGMDKLMSGMYYVLLFVGGIVMYARIGFEEAGLWVGKSAVKGWKYLGRSKR